MKCLAKDCPITGWARANFCPTCTHNSDNASRREDMEVDSEFSTDEDFRYHYSEPPTDEADDEFGGGDKP
jgi:hypothetical protein